MFTYADEHLRTGLPNDGFLSNALSVLFYLEWFLSYRLLYGIKF